MTAPTLARLVAEVAADLDRRGYPSAGIVRMAARELAAITSTTNTCTSTNGCKGCGTEVAQPATGRRREWCSERCRRQHRR